MSAFPPMPLHRVDGVTAAVPGAAPRGASRAVPAGPEPRVLTHAKLAVPPAETPGWPEERRAAWLAWIEWLRADAERHGRYLPSVAVVMTTWHSMRATIQADARKEKEAFDAWLPAAQRLKAAGTPDSEIPPRPNAPCLA